MIPDVSDPGRCLEDHEIHLLLEGKVRADARAGLLAHIDGCDACQRLVAAAAAADDTGDPAEHALERGAPVGRYLVLSVLGSGGMGTVFVAYDPELDRRVALKLLHAAGGSEGARGRLAREARALGRLSHPNVVQVYDVGEHGGDVFVAMELVDGQTLDAWCRGAPKPAFREVIAAYLDAARGLGAAHDKGLVHRDVKPSNILRGHDGRVRVADFGLAADRPEAPSSPPAANVAIPPLGDTLPAPTRPKGSIDELTATGALVGTPLYMAPEQHEGSRLTAASDQYSLCLALHQSLYGKLPFTVDPGVTTLASLLARKKAGPPAAPPPGSPVPGWVYKALSRGLALEPEGRYPSMAALAEALGADPDARRHARRRNAGIGVGVVVGLMAVAAGWARASAVPDPCAHPERQLSGVWDEGVKGRVEAAFLGAGRPHAAETFARVDVLLDGYAAEWASMRGEVCRAPRGEARRREILGLRDACLDRRRSQLAALTTLFAEKVDPKVPDGAVRAAAGLYPIAYCADVDALTARVRPPEDPALRARVAALEPQVDRLEALYMAGQYKEGKALGEQLLAERIPYAPLRAQAEFVMGRLRERSGDYEAAKALLFDASASAAEGRDDDRVLAAWSMLLVIAGDRQRHFEEASMLRSLAPAITARVQDARLTATWANAEGILFVRGARYPEAKAALERAVALREKALPPQHPDLASALNNLGLVLHDMGEYAQAVAKHERALAIWEHALGPAHPDVAMSLNNLGIALRNLGLYARALDAHERALAIWEKALPGHADLATALNNLGLVHYYMGAYDRALVAHERALALSEKAVGPDHPSVAYILAALGRTQVRLGQLDAAQTTLERALAMREKGPSASNPHLAEPLLGLGELHIARHEPAKAVLVLRRALALKNRDYVLELELSLAEALWQTGHDHTDARALAEAARAAYEQIGHRPGVDRATRWLAEHHG